MRVSLKWLLEGIAAWPGPDLEIDDLAIDSRLASPGCAFLAFRGASAHGVDFAHDAAARGARAILWEQTEDSVPPRLPREVLAVAVPRLRAALGTIADRFFHSPSASLRIVGITGTNGKTTCCYMLAQALERLGVPAAYMGTIGWGRIDALQAPTHTTPDAVTVHRALAQLKAQGVREVAMEVSSHALDQGRVDGVVFHAAAFTNLTRDHLDYHLSMQAYGAAKTRLFAVPGLKEAVINIDDDFGRELASSLAGRVPVCAVWIGERAAVAERRAADDRSLSATAVRLDAQGISMSVVGTPGELDVERHGAIARTGRDAHAAQPRCEAELSTRLLGRFNAENALIVLGCLESLGVSLGDAVRALAECSAPPGRMEVIESSQSQRPLAVVDYAHTPDALEKALGALREHCRGALWCVFGCGGDRDPGKRALMGAVADHFADRIIVTDDNPRSEDPLEIIRAIVSGIKTHLARVIPDRGAAIATALADAAAGDVVLIAGKGHEDYQIYGATRRSFSDRAQARKVLGAAA